jgi:choline dehydrogenase
MLSGVGPGAQLSKMGIPVVSDLPGVGQNMQDRYEASVVGGLASNITVVLSCTPGQPNDPCLAQWLQGKGPYTINEAAITALLKSDSSQLVRDLMITLAAGPFHGYYPGWQGPVTSTPNQFSWLMLKAHTINRAGTVQLNSTDPRDMPLINFHYFQEGNDTANQDLNALVRGMTIARDINSKLGSIFTGEVLPGSKYQTAADLATWVKNEAWGHHASCSSKMGPSTDSMAVVDSDFRVYGTQNLRVVDASVFPRIPGYYVMVPIMMISEKASDVILADASSQG